MCETQMAVVQVGSEEWMVVDGNYAGDTRGRRKQPDYKHRWRPA